MGLLNSKQWEEMTEMQDAEKERQNKDKNTEEVKERRSFRDKFRTRILRSDARSPSDGVDRTPIAKAEKHQCCETPVQSKLKSLVDPRSPGGEVERTPIVVDEAVRRRVLSEECDTPVRGQVPAAITIPVAGSKLSDDRSPLLIEMGDDDPRSPSTLKPRTPITSAVPAIDLINRPSEEHLTPATVDLNALQEKPKTDRKTDKGQPSSILQAKFKEAVASAALAAPDLLSTTPAAATEDLEDSDISLKSSNDSSLVI